MNRVAPILILSIFAMVEVGAWEPVSMVLPTESNRPAEKFFDHLLPADRHIVKGDYLVRYAQGAALAGFRVHHLGIRQQEGRYFLKDWDTWDNPQTLSPSPLPPAVEVEISADLATSVYEMWVNALYEVRYERGLQPMVADGEQSVFCARVPSSAKAEYLAGYIDNAEGELPPSWLEQAAEALTKFSQNHDEKSCRDQIKALHDKLFSYWRIHGTSAAR